MIGCWDGPLGGVDRCRCTNLHVYPVKDCARVTGCWDGPLSGVDRCRCTNLHVYPVKDCVRVTSCWDSPLSGVDRCRCTNLHVYPVKDCARVTGCWDGPLSGVDRYICQAAGCPCPLVGCSSAGRNPGQAKTYPGTAIWKTKTGKKLTIASVRWKM